jgi:hypothetical protein
MMSVGLILGVRHAICAIPKIKKIAGLTLNFFPPKGGNEVPEFDFCDLVNIRL